MARMIMATIFFSGSELNFRSLAGVNARGHCVFIVSGRGGLMTIEDVTQIARLAGIRDATLLDGGKALQYGMAGEYGSASFQQLQTTSYRRKCSKAD